MSINRIFAVLAAAGALLLVLCIGRANASPAGRTHPLTPGAQDASKIKLAAAKSVKCTFPLMALGTWAGEKADAKVKPAQLVLEFDDINTDEGTARLESGFGQYDITVRYADGYLHFIQSFLTGPLYTTTILDKKTPAGKLKAMHSRHEYTDFALPGFTSSPEQYYGDCEVLK